MHRDISFLCHTAARPVLKAPKRDHVSPLLRAFHWLPIEARIENKLSTFYHSFFFPSLIQPLIICLTFFMSTLHRDSSALPLTQELRISHLKTKTFGHLSFFYTDPSVWNSLPREIRHIQSTTAFKTVPTTHLSKFYLY